MESHTTSAQREIEAARQGLEAAQAWLAEAPLARLTESLAEAAQRLLSTWDGVLPEPLLQQSGLSEPMLRWGLRSTLGAISEAGLMRLAETHTPEPPPGPCGVILSGNLVTAPIRAVLLPLLARRPVLAKTAVGQDAVTRTLSQALAASDTNLGQCLSVHSFPRSDTAATETLLRTCPVVAAYGDDASLAALQAQLPNGSRLLPHGHGLGTIYLGQPALAGDGLRGMASRTALDVAAYDQRGCLSPHHIFLERGRVSAPAFAEALMAALDNLAGRLPRGHVPEAERAAIAQWRGVAAACGQLWEADSHAIAIEDSPRPGPGYRHVAIIEVDDRAQWLATVAPWAEHLKTVALAGCDRAALNEVAEALDRHGQHPHLAEVGEIQAPPLGALTDGRAPLAGL